MKQVKNQPPVSLTEKETKVLSFIETYQANEGFSPTYQEIREHFQFASFNSVQNYLKQLATKGYIQFEAHQKRAIQILKSAGALSDFVSESHSSLTKSPRGRLLPDSFTASETLTLPLLGKVAAGTPLESLNHDDFISVPPNLVKEPNSSYVLKVKGSSMINDGIFDGDYLVVQNINRANNGDTVIASINDESTVKKFYLKNNKVELRPANDNLQSFWYSPEEVKIQGIVVSLFRKF